MVESPSKTKFSCTTLTVFAQADEEDRFFRLSGQTSK
jgi:hypothetical protein